MSHDEHPISPDAGILERLLDALKAMVPDIPAHTTVEIDATVIQILMFDRETGMVARVRMVAAVHADDGRIVAQVQTIH